MIVKYPNPILRQPSERVEPSDDVRDVAEKLRAALRHAQGLGLAAQQVGSTKRVAIVTFGPNTLIAINLEIVERSKASVLSTREGCLSVTPGGKLFRMNVRRAARVKVRYEDERRAVHEHWVGGLDAIVAQHEAEHLDGRCIIDRLTPEQLARLA
jgi:peptide deformylase